MRYQLRFAEVGIMLTKLLTQSHGHQRAEIGILNNLIQEQPTTAQRSL